MTRRRLPEETVADIVRRTPVKGSIVTGPARHITAEEPGFLERHIETLCLLACIAIWMAWAIAEWRI